MPKVTKLELFGLFFLAIVLGILLTWGCVTSLGLLVLWFAENRLFGLPVNTAVAIEGFLAWTPISLVTGIVLGVFIRTYAVKVGFATASVALATLLVSSPEFPSASGSLEQTWEMLVVYLSSGAFLLFAVPLGALMAQRLRLTQNV